MTVKGVSRESLFGSVFTCEGELEIASLIKSYQSLRYYSERLLLHPTM